MSKFSRRYGYNKKYQETILEDAPSWLRLAYINGALHHFTCIDGDDRYSNEGEPVGIKELSEIILGSLGQDIDDTMYDSWYCWDYLKSLITDDCEWYDFYDVIEIVGTKTLETEQQTESVTSSPYSYERYRQMVNDLFAEFNVGWRLDNDSQLKKAIPEALEKRIQQVGEQLKDQFDPAREHYAKAVRYSIEPPLDSENSIKEVISAIESIGRVLYPNASTLGGVVKEMRKDDRYPTHLVTMIDKFNAYANSEPGIRHGIPAPSNVLLDDAEFCLHVGAALIRYLITNAPN